MNKPKEIVGFHFQEIPLEEARRIVVIGEGAYSEIKSHLLDKLPSLAPDVAFCFGMPGNKETPEDQRRGICQNVNMTLKHAGLNWKVTYSSARKLFICLPKENAKHVAPERVVSQKFKIGIRGTNDKLYARAVELYRQGTYPKKISELIPELSIPQVNYAIHKWSKKNGGSK
jgi:hypothetical protein